MEHESIHCWKRTDRRYHEDTGIVGAYDDVITRKYLLEHEIFTLDIWAEELKDSGKSLVLDYGCGTGTASLKIMKKGIRVVSMDASLQMVKLLKKKAEKEDLPCLCVVGDAENLPFKDSSFDGLVCAGVLHHLPGMEKGAREQSRMMKKDGLLFIAEPFRGKPWFSYPYYLAIQACRFVRNIMKPSSLTTQERLLNKNDLDSVCAILSASGFEISVSYFVYWPVVFGYLPRFITCPLLKLLNWMKADSARGDSFIIRARKKQD